MVPYTVRIIARFKRINSYTLEFSQNFEKKKYTK